MHARNTLHWRMWWHLWDNSLPSRSRLTSADILKQATPWPSVILETEAQCSSLIPMTSWTSSAVSWACTICWRMTRDGVLLSMTCDGQLGRCWTQNRLEGAFPPLYCHTLTDALSLMRSVHTEMVLLRLSPRRTASIASRQLWQCPSAHSCARFPSGHAYLTCM